MPKEKDNKTGVVLGEALELAIRYLAIERKERKIQDTIRALLIRDADVVAIAERYGIDLTSDKVERGGYKRGDSARAEIVPPARPVSPVPPTVPGSEDESPTDDTPRSASSSAPAVQHSTASSPAQVLAQRRADAAIKRPIAGMPQRRNGTRAVVAVDE